jgi:hypothetical protein
MDNVMINQWILPWTWAIVIPIGSMYAIYGNIYHQYTPNVSIYTIHGSYGICPKKQNISTKNEGRILMICGVSIEIGD